MARLLPRCEHWLMITIAGFGSHSGGDANHFRSGCWQALEWCSIVVQVDHMTVTSWWFERG